MSKDEKKPAATANGTGTASARAIVSEAEHKMRKAVERVLQEYATIRSGRAAPAILDRVEVEYYGAPTPIKQIATISAPDARTLLVTPFDKSALKAIEKGIQQSDLGLNPNNDGQVIRPVFPPPTEERRKDLVKLAKKEAEEGKIAIRNVRRDEMDKVKALEKKSEINQDESKGFQDQLQKLTDRFVNEVDKTLTAKEAEIMEV